MPHSILVKFIPQQSRSFDVSLGQQIHALFLNTIRKVDPVLSRELHDEVAGKPFTVSLPLTKNRRPLNQFIAGEECYVRYTVFSNKIWQIFPQVISSLCNDTVHISRTEVKIISVSLSAEGNEKASETYQEIWEAEPANKFEISFISPTSFRLQGHSFLLPLPSLMYAGYLKKWNKYSNYEIPESVLERINDRLLISKVNLSSQVLRYSNYFQIGFTGQVMLNAADYSLGESKYLSVLTRFANYCGTGHKTTMGMGQTRVKLII
jgi:CRISPR-associated endoribonuclease Cas6